MLGVVLEYDDTSESGVISGDDGVRYAFRRSDLQKLWSIATGAKVDFIPKGDAATAIYMLDASGWISGGDPGRPAQARSRLPADAYTGEALSVWGYFGKVVRKSFIAEGRARRTEFWSFFLVYALVMWAPTMALMPVVMNVERGYSVFGLSPSMVRDAATAFIALVALASLLLLPAMICLAIRRLHDVGMSGFAIFAGIVPVFGTLFLLVCYLLPSTTQPSRYGPIPKPRPNTYAK